MMDEKHPIGGQVFRVIGESTVDHDLTLMGYIHQAGLSNPSLLEGETPEEYAVRLLGEISASGKALPMLGCLLLPDGVSSEEWTPEIGRQTAEFLGRLVQPEDKAAVSRLIVRTLTGFFVEGLASWVTSATSSVQPPTGVMASQAPETATDAGAS